MAIDILTLALAKKMSSSSGGITDEQVNSAVNAWLNEHPEATTTVQDNSVTPDMTTFFRHTTVYHNDNWFDWNNAEQGVLVNCETGESTPGTSYIRTCPAFPVEPGENIFIGRIPDGMGLPINSNSSWAYYDKNMNFLPQPKPTAMGAWNPVPDKAAFMRVSVQYGQNQIMIVRGTTETPAKYVAYNRTEEVNVGWKDSVLREAVLDDATAHMRENLSLPGDSIDDFSIGLEKNEFVKFYNLNIVNPAEIESKTIISYNGDTTAYQYCDTTGFCSVEPGRTYYPSILVNDLWWYDSEKKPIEKAKTPIIFAGYTAPKNAAFLRATYGTEKEIGISDYKYGFYVQPFGAKKVVITEELLGQALNENMKTFGDVTAFKWERWNLADEYSVFKGSIDESGKVTFTGIDSTIDYAYIVDVTPGTDYLFKGRNSNPVKVFQYDEDWSFVGTTTISITHGDAYAFVYTPGENVYHAVVKCAGFIAKSGNANKLLDILGSTVEENLKAQYVPVNVPEYVRKWAIQNIVTGESNTLLQTIHNSKGLKWVCLGDSLTTNGWGDHNMYGIVSKKLGIDAVNYGIVSSTLADYKQDGTTGNPMCIRYAEMDADADIVTVMGGTNDYIPGDITNDKENTATVVGACHALFKGLIEKYPNAKIGIILPPQWGYGIPSWVATQGGDPGMNGLRSTVNAIKSVAEYYSLPVCDLFNHGGIPGMLESSIGRLLQMDHVHLTNEGHKTLSRPLLAFIEDLIG